MTDEERPRLADVSHTNPHTGEPFGGVYRRGPAMADGGEVPERTGAGEDADDAGETTVADVDHEAPDDSGANAVWKRGEETDADTDSDGDETPVDAAEDGDDGPRR